MEWSNKERHTSTSQEWLRCARITITRLMQRLRQTGQTSDKPRIGRPRVTTPREDRYIRVLHLRNRTLTATSTATTALGHRISRQTVYRRLRQYGIRPRHPYRGPYLTPRHKNGRLIWARRVRRWQRRDWARVLFSDESNSSSSEMMDGRLFTEELVNVWRLTVSARSGRLEVEGKWFGLAYVVTSKRGLS